MLGGLLLFSAEIGEVLYAQEKKEKEKGKLINSPLIYDSGMTFLLPNCAIRVDHKQKMATLTQPEQLSVISESLGEATMVSPFVVVK